ncbi:MAG: hypothetical protein LC662_08040 [Rhodothermaceae bacterium]|nr:hypothetical protein [Rhodothermaceae bacterium]
MAERIVWIIICLALAAALVYVVNRQEAPQPVDAAGYEAELGHLESKIDSLRSVLDEMQHTLQPREYDAAAETGDLTAEPATRAGTGALMQYEIRQFRSLGLENPEEDILTDLFNNPQLIPHEGVLGGTMRFHSMDDLKLINGSWAYARYEDGHITGEMLLEYKVGRNGIITWNIIRASSL